MSKKSQDELLSYGFLLDRDVSKAVSLFPRKRTKTIADIGLPPNATDAQIVREAWQRQLIIITGNGDDFVKEIHKFLSRTTRNECHEMYGLVVLPNGYERQKRLLPNIEKKLSLGKERLNWNAIAYRNCYVRVTRSGRAEVRRFPRCFFCLRNEKNDKG